MRWRCMVGLFISFSGYWIDLAVIPRQMLSSPTVIITKSIWMNIATHRLSVKQSVEPAATVKRFILWPILSFQINNGRELFVIPSVHVLRSWFTFVNFLMPLLLLWLERLLDYLRVFQLSLFLKLITWTKLVNRRLSVRMLLLGCHFSHLFIPINASTPCSL